MKVNNDIKNIVKELGNRQWDDKKNIFLLVDSGNYSRYEVCDYNYIFQMVFKDESKIVSKYFDDRGVMNNNLNIALTKEAATALGKLCDLYTDDVNSVELMKTFYGFHKDALIFELNPDEKMISKGDDYKCVKVPVTSVTDGLDTKEVEFYKENGKSLIRINLNGFENVAEYITIIDDTECKNKIDGIFAGLYNYYVDPSISMLKTVMDESELIAGWKNYCFTKYQDLYLEPQNSEGLFKIDIEDFTRASNIVSSMNNVLKSHNIIEAIIDDLSTNYGVIINTVDLEQYANFQDFAEKNNINLEYCDSLSSILDDCIEKGIFLDEVNELKDAEEIIEL